MSFTIWFTGLPCSGKTTLAQSLQSELQRRGTSVKLLDGDALRNEISPDLGYSEKDRIIHVARVTDLALSFVQTGIPTLVALISPYRSMRDDARKRLPRFVEVYVRCPLSVCENRDVKGMYRLARQDKIRQFTGVSAPYEEPEHPELVMDTDRSDVPSCLFKIMHYLELNKMLLPSFLKKSGL